MGEDRRYLLSWETRRALPACTRPLPDGGSMQDGEDHDWSVLGRPLLFCQRCTLVVEIEEKGG